MKKITVIWAIIFFSLSAILYAQNFRGRIEKISISEPERGLVVGEALQYSVEWLGVPVGKIILKVEGLEDIRGHKCYHITAQAFPNHFFKRFYDLEYTVHTYLDTQFFYPLRFEKIRRIKGERNNVLIDFDQEKNEAKFESRGSGLLVKISPVREEMKKERPINFKIAKGTQDLLSSFYYLRILEIKENQAYPINIYYDQRNWSVNMKVEKPFLKDIYKKGTFSVIRVYPDSDLNSYILGKRNFSVYFTTDSRRIPIEFKLNTALGPIRGVIQDLPRQ